jgi:hypothetical protein
MYQCITMHICLVFKESLHAKNCNIRVQRSTALSVHRTSIIQSTTETYRMEITLNIVQVLSNQQQRHTEWKLR